MGNSMCSPPQGTYKLRNPLLTFLLIFCRKLELSLWLFRSSSNIPLLINLLTVQRINSLWQHRQHPRSWQIQLAFVTTALLIVPPNTFFRSSSVVLPPRFLTNCCLEIPPAWFLSWWRTKGPTNTCLSLRSIPFLSQKQSQLILLAETEQTSLRLTRTIGCHLAWEDATKS